jgi:hypothetical protein
MKQDNNTKARSVFFKAEFCPCRMFHTGRERISGCLFAFLNSGE